MSKSYGFLSFFFLVFVKDTRWFPCVTSLNTVLLWLYQYSSFSCLYWREDFGTDFFFKHVTCLGGFCVFEYWSSGLGGKFKISQAECRDAIEVAEFLYMALSVWSAFSFLGLVHNDYPCGATFVQCALPHLLGRGVSRTPLFETQTTLQRWWCQWKAISEFWQE